MTRVRTMDEVAAEATSRPRFRATLVGTFALLSLALAAVGIFGVLTFSVRERTREFGVRIALGATRADILGLVVGAGLKIAGAGAARRTRRRRAADAHARVAALRRHAARSGDVPGAPVVLVATALVASMLPALRAVRVDPAVTLRQE